MTEKRFVEIVTYTWSKDSHGLFDYESPHLFINTFKASGPTQFFRNGNDIFSVENPTTDSANSNQNNPNNLIFEINQDPDLSGQFRISTKNASSANKSLDLVVRAIKKEGQPAGHELNVGDIIKIGRVRFLVREKRDANGVVNKIRTIQEIPFKGQERIQEEESKIETEQPVQEEACRICLMNDLYPDPLDNTLVAPCKCKGSCEYVHLRCLKQWVDSKKSSVERSDNICLNFNYKKLSCEICKFNLPYVLKMGKQEYDIIDIKRPDNIPYLVLEKIETLRENKGLFLLKASEQDIQLGRGHAHQILVSDISVSRNHAQISYKDGKFILFDNNSKFGTLVQIDEPIEITPEKTILQCGKTVIILCLKKEENVLAKPGDEGANNALEEEVEAPQTPSTANEQDNNDKLSSSESKKVKKLENKEKKARRRTNKLKKKDEVKEELERGEENAVDIDLCEMGTEIGRGDSISAANLLSTSKKIFKIMRSDTDAQEVGNFRRERRVRRNVGQGEEDN